MDLTYPEQPDNILRQQPGGEDDTDDEDLNAAQGGDEQPMEIGEEDDPGNIIRNIVHGGDEQPMEDQPMQTDRLRRHRTPSSPPWFTWNQFSGLAAVGS
jgi:hypothetical protein